MRRFQTSTMTPQRPWMNTPSYNKDSCSSRAPLKMLPGFREKYLPSNHTAHLDQISRESLKSFPLPLHGLQSWAQFRAQMSTLLFSLFLLTYLFLMLQILALVLQTINNEILEPICTHRVATPSFLYLLSFICAPSLTSAVVQTWIQTRCLQTAHPVRYQRTADWVATFWISHVQTRTQTKWFWIEEGVISVQPATHEVLSALKRVFTLLHTDVAHRPSWDKLHFYVKPYVFVKSLMTQTLCFM